MYYQSEYAISSFVFHVHKIKATSTVQEQSKSCAGTRPYRLQKLCGNKATSTVREQGHIDCAGTRPHRLCGNKATLTAKAVREQGYIDYKSCVGTRPHRLQKLCGNKATSTAKAMWGTRPHRLQKLCGNKAISTVREQSHIDCKSYVGTKGISTPKAMRD